MASQTRDKILKEGSVRYRQSTLALQKWKPRYLVFKATRAGRLQLVVYKESPPSEANEVKEIAIDEFGGLEQNLKIDNEKFVFAIITTHITECFSTETPHELTEWRQLLQEYLGKELVVNITIPPKQHMLKAGRATLRIRNTGFTISTCDNPPRCQGTWHIIHIRKYGGTDMFRFQTGSKCPTGEYLYSIETKDNLGIKNLFNDLSNHRPIFADDRLGRRMTLEHRTNPNVPSRVGNNRLSLQAADRSSDKHLYENREQFHTVNGRHNTSDLSVPHNDVRRASFDEGILDPLKTNSSKDTRQATPSHKTSTTEDDRFYQNCASSPYSRTSPTKKTHLSPISVPVPEGYYNLTPPTLVRHRSSSPEDSNLPEHMSLFNPPSTHRSETNSDRSSQELSMSIVGDSLVVNKTARSHSKALSPPTDAAEVGGKYQNVEFMRAESHGSKRNVGEAAVNDEVAPIIPATISEEPWSPHNYTNVAFAQAIAQGQATSSPTQAQLKSRKSRMNTPLHKTRSAGQSVSQTREEHRKSVPVKSQQRDSPLQSTPIQTLVVSTSSDDLLSPSPVNSTQVLRTSLSNIELNSSSKDKSLDYYNFCAANLPAHSKSQNKSLSLRNKLTLSSGRKVSSHSSDALLSHKSAEALLSPDSPDAPYNKLSKSRKHEMDTASDSDIPLPAYASIDDLKLKSDATADKKLSSSCDCLDVYEPTKSLTNGRPDPHNAMYDKLTPLQDEINGAKLGIYDSLSPNKDEVLSGSSSPDPDDLSLDLYSLKANFLKRTHTYEYIDVDLENRKSRSTSSSPTGMEHPLDWTKSLQRLHRERSPHLSFSKETNTLPRRKQLPLQESPGEQITDAEYSTTKKAMPPRLSRESSVEMTDSPLKSVLRNFNRVSQARSSVDSMDMVSSSESVSGARRESVFSSGSTSSVELDTKLSSTSTSTAAEHLRQEHSNSPSHRVTREDVALRGRAVSPQDEPQSPSSDEPPPIPKKGLMEPATHKAPAEKQGSHRPPPRPQEPRFTVPLPRAQFDFVKPPPPPRPKVLCSSDLSYAAVTFANGENPVYSEVDPAIRISRPSMTISQAHSDVSYVAVDFQMTEGLQRTSEQVADFHREFFETTQQS